MDEDEFCEDCLPVSHPFSKIDLLIVGLGAIRNCFNVAAVAVDALQDLAIGHALHKSDEREFAMSAAMEIERLTEGD